MQVTEKYNRHLRVISFCLWGDKKIYCDGLLENIKLAKTYYPDWTCWVYIHEESVPDEFVKAVKRHDNTRIILKKGSTIRKLRYMLWRLEPADNTDVEYLISRDTDSRISPREVMAVNEWIAEGTALHIMRDHPQHFPKILGGMYGFRCADLPIMEQSWEETVDMFYRDAGEDTNDQLFLERAFYLRFANNRTIHDEVMKYEGDECRKFPIPFEQNGHFVGCYIYKDGSTDFETAARLLQFLRTNAPDRVSFTPITMHESLCKVRQLLKRVYVMHYSKLVDRRVSLESQLGKMLLDKFVPIEWVDEFDREKITKEQIVKYYNYNPRVMARVMTLPEIANGIAHTTIMERIQERNEISLILEDDTMFKEGFIHHLRYVLENLPPDWEMICLGGPTQPNIMPARSMPNSCDMKFTCNEITLFKPSSPGPCTASCLLVSKKGADKILGSDLFIPMSAPIDEAIWQAAKVHDLKMYWAQPWLSYEGSKDDSMAFSTSLERGFG